MIRQPLWDFPMIRASFHIEKSWNQFHRICDALWRLWVCLGPVPANNFHTGPTLAVNNWPAGRAQFFGHSSGKLCTKVRKITKLQINEAYSCSEHCSPPLPECLHGGYPHPNDCTRCQCPNGFSGRNCQSVQPSSCGGTIQAFLECPNHFNRSM